MELTCPSCQRPFATTTEGERAPRVCPHCDGSPSPQQATAMQPTGTDAETMSLRRLASELVDSAGIVERFDKAYRTGSPPSVAQYLSEASVDDVEVAVELMQTELARALAAGNDVRVETYLDSFEAELQSRDDLVKRLIVAEYKLRQQYGFAPSVDDFRHRFPQFADELQNLLLAPWLPSSSRLSNRTRCPHCFHPIEVGGTEERCEIRCEACGEQFQFVLEQASKWSSTGLSRIGKFQLQKVVGRGAFGTVYRAHDSELDRTVAIKVPRSGTFLTPKDEERFLREARSAAQLDHPGIVKVYDAGKTDEFPYIVTEFVHGLTLASTMKEARFSFDEAAELVATVAEALQHAHQRGVVHRDLKPSNIMIDADGKPRVMDFGLARYTLGEVTVTLEGVLGTPMYMSPEQARGESASADARSDVYSLGVLLFELLTNERPFRGDSLEVMRQVVEVDPPRVRTLNRKIPLDLETIASKCLEKAPSRRYSTAGELAVELRRHLRREPILARPIGKPERAWRWCKRNPGLVRSTVAIFGILVIALCVVSYFWQRERQAHNDALARLRDANRAVDVWLTVFSEAFRDLPGFDDERKAVLREAAKTYESFAEQVSGDETLNLERAQAWYRLGDVHLAWGETEPAERSFRRAERILTTMRGSDSVEPQVALGRTQIRLGATLGEQGDSAAALDAYEGGIRRLRMALSKQADHELALDGVAAGLAGKALVCGNNGDFETAERLIVEAISVLHELQAADRRNDHYEMSLADAESVHGKIAYQRQDFDKAQQLFSSAIHRLDKLLEESPHDLGYMVSRADKRLLLAATRRERGQDDTTIQEMSYVDYDELSRRFPQAPQYDDRRRLALSHLASAAIDRGDLQKAEQFLVEMIFQLDPLTSREDARKEHRAQLAKAKLQLGQVYRDRKQTGAEQLFEASLTTWNNLVSQYESDPEYRELRAITRSHLAQHQHGQRDLSAAITNYQAAATELDELAHGNPKQAAQYRYEAGFVYWYLGETLWDQQAKTESRQAFDNSKVRWNAIANPTPKTLDEFARFLVLCRDPETRDASLAIELAKEAVGKVPDERFLATLGAAQYRADRPQDAVATLASVKNHVDGFVLFFSAMANVRAGHLEAARSRFEEGAAWHTSQRPGDLILERLHAEAGELLAKQ